MEYIFLIEIKDLVKKDNIPLDDINKIYLNAKKLCDERLLYVTLDGKIPTQPEDIVGWVDNISLSVRKDVIMVRIETFNEVEDNIITDTQEMVNYISRGGSYNAKMIKSGRLISLYKRKDEENG